MRIALILQTNLVLMIFNFSSLSSTVPNFELSNALSSFDYDNELLFQLEGKTLSLVTYAKEHVDGVVDKNGILQANKIVESVVRDMQLMSSFRVKLKKLEYSEVNLTLGYFEGGVGEQLTNGEADIGIGYFYITPARVKTWSPLLPLLSERLYAYFEQPKSSSVRNIFLQPLHPDVFAVYFFFILLLGSIIISLRFSWFSNWLDSTEIIVVLVSLVTQRSYSFSSNFWSSGRTFLLKFIFLKATFLSCIIYLFYSTKLLNVMMSRVQSINSVNDLHKHDYIFHIKAALVDIVTDSKKPFILRVVNDTVDPLNEFAAAVHSERHCYVTVELTSVNNGDMLTKFRNYVHSLNPTRNPDDQICESMSTLRMENSNFPLAGTFYVKKNSPLRGPLNIHILKIRECGLLRRYHSYTNNGTLICFSKSKYLENLGMDDVLSAFIFLGALTLLALLILLLEKIDIWQIKRMFIFKLKRRANLS